MPSLHTKGTLYVSEADGTTICASDHHGVAATAPDPLCKEHYVGGPIGGNYFAPIEDPLAQKANAARIALAWNCFDELVESLTELARTVDELEDEEGDFSNYDWYGMMRRARDILRRAGVSL